VCTIDSLDVFLSPAEEETLWVDVFPFGVPGSGTMEMRVRAHDPPLEVRSHFVGAIHGVTRLVVDDDGGAAYEDYLVDSFAANGITAGVWPLWIAPPRAADLAAFASVYWLTGNATASTLTAADRITSLPTSTAGPAPRVRPGLVTTSVALLPRPPGAAFSADDAGSTDVTGVAGDPIGNGLPSPSPAAQINQVSPDAIQALRHPVSPRQRLTPARGRGRRHLPQRFLAFGFEGVADAQARALLSTAPAGSRRSGRGRRQGTPAANPALATAVPEPVAHATWAPRPRVRPPGRDRGRRRRAGRRPPPAGADGTGGSPPRDGRDLGARAPAGVYFFDRARAGLAARGRPVVTR
jgi:hypothetical protein